jgi:hypothetical protein
MVFRLDPVLPAHAYKTYAITRPAASHYRPATCAEVDCAHYRDGWVTRIDTSTPLGAAQARYILDRSGRRYTLTSGASPDGDEFALVIFTFPPGQPCFTAHRVPLERDPLFVVRGGDWRGNPMRERRQHVRASEWAEDFAEHQQALADQINKG